jgi:predicted nucleic acid-binding protein
MAAAVCVDASYFLAILLREELAPQAGRLADGWLAERRPILGPPLFWAETTSIIREQVFRGRYTAAEASQALDLALRIPLSTWGDDRETLQRRAYQLAERFAQPKAYDAQYLAVADLAGCELWTADERLYNSVRGQIRWVRWIGER